MKPCEVNIVEEIGRNSMVLRIIQRDDLGLITKATLFPIPRPFGHASSRAEIDLDPLEVSKLVNDPYASFPMLSKLTPGRNISRLGFLELGLPDDGSEWWVLTQ